MKIKTSSKKKGVVKLNLKEIGHNNEIMRYCIKVMKLKCVKYSKIIIILINQGDGVN